MSSHEGVSCDSCLRFNFRGKRYKCLICLDYDLCSQCHQSGVISGRHSRDHPMQCILTRTDLDLFFAGETIINHLPYSFTCPICGKLGLSDASLYTHVNRYHQGQIFSVVCPICATLPDREPNQVTDNFYNHLILEHRNRSNNSNRETDDSQARIPQRARVSSRSRRSQLGSTSTTTTTTTTTSAAAATTSNRDVMDPISQLLSQLSEAHRMTGQSNGSWRFPFERMTSTNRSLERLMVRHRRGAPSNFSWATLSDEQNSNQSLPYSLMDSTSPLLLSSNGNANSSTAQSNQSKTEHKYLLDKCSLILPENEIKKFDTLKADRSEFIQELIFACLFNYSINADNILTNDNETKIQSDNDNLNINDNFTDNNENDENNENIKNTENDNDAISSSEQLIDDGTAPELLLNLKDEEKASNVNLNMATSETKSLERNVLYSANSTPTTFSLNEAENRQLSPIPSSAFLVPQASVNHRNNKTNKVRSTNSMASPLTIRSSINGNGNTINVVSPSTRRKILKQHTEPHHYN